LSFTFDTSGFDRVIKDLDRKAKSINGPVSFDILFNDSFMAKNTNYPTLDSFFSACGINSTDEFHAFPDDQMDSFVKDNSVFSSWENMQISAAEQYAIEKFK